MVDDGARRTQRATVAGMTDRPAWLIPLGEWRAMNADQAPAEVRELDERERADLRARLNAPGGARLTLTPGEQAAYYEMGVIRSPEQVSGLVAQVRAEARADRREGLAYAQGILDAVGWVAGRWPGPISDETPAGARPSMVEIKREESAAREAAEGRRTLLRPQGYAVGVEATLMWLSAGCDDPPW